MDVADQTAERRWLSEPMKVVILCGGQGTRLREETEFRPKPLVEVGGKPILWHIMKVYAQYGLHDFILCLGYRGNMIKEYFLNYEAMNNDFTICLGQKSQLHFNGAHKEQDFRVTLADTGQETMTGGRIKRIEKHVDGDTFLVTYGDGLADVNIADLVAFHKSHGKIATVTTVRPHSRFGILETASDGSKSLRRPNLTPNLTTRPPISPRSPPASSSPPGSASPPPSPSPSAPPWSPFSSPAKTAIAHASWWSPAPTHPRGNPR